MTVPLNSCLATDRGPYGNWLSTAGQSKTEHASNGLVNAGARTGARNLFRRNGRSGVLLRNKFRAPPAFIEALRMRERAPRARLSFDGLAGLGVQNEGADVRNHSVLRGKTSIGKRTTVTGPLWVWQPSEPAVRSRALKAIKSVAGGQ